MCACLVAQLCLTLCDPMDCSPPVHGDSTGKNTGELLCSPPGDLSNSGIEPRSSTLQADSLPSKPRGKAKSTGMGSLPLLQGVFLMQG